jgi:hypothetical protein
MPSMDRGWQHTHWTPALKEIVLDAVTQDVHVELPDSWVWTIALST